MGAKIIYLRFNFLNKKQKWK